MQIRRTNGFVYADNFIERKIGTINPKPKDVFYYTVEALEVKPQFGDGQTNLLEIDSEAMLMESLINNPAIAFQHRDSLSLKSCSLRDYRIG